MHTNDESTETVAMPPSDWNDSYTGEVGDYEAPDPDLLELVDGLPPGRALDVGCGAGGLVLALAQRGWEVTGIDLADRAISAASKLLAERGLHGELIVADATAWRPATQYDLIVSSFALPEGSERGAVLRMIRAALAPGGTVGVKEFDSAMSRYRHFSGFDLVTLEELTAAFAGFEIVRAEIVDTPVHEHARGVVDAAEAWTAAMLHARRPRSAALAQPVSRSSLRGCELTSLPLRVNRP